MFERVHPPPAESDATSAPTDGPTYLPAAWELVEELADQNFRWPNATEPEHYDPFKVYDDEGQFVSVIKGNGPRKRSLYGADEQLPAAYGDLTTALYPERVHSKGVWRKQVVVASEDDHETMLAHSLMQAQMRSGVVPK